MAGRFVAALPDPEGFGYTFQSDDGSELFLPRDPETDAMAASLSMTAPGSGATAEAPTGPLESRADVAPNMSAMPQSLPGDTATAAPMPEGVPGAPTPSAAPMPQAPPGAQPVDQDAQAAQMAAMAATTPGSAGVSQEQLQRRAQTGVETPKTSTTTVEGAVPYDEEAAAGRAVGREARRIAQQEQAVAEQAYYLSEEENAGREAMLAETRKAGARAALQERDNRIAADEMSFRQLRAARANGQIDPNRIFKGEAGTLMTIGAILAQGIGAYAATLGGGPNFAQQIIQGAIDRDVAAQKDAFDRMGDEADNMYRDLVREYGDRDQAEAALRSLQKDAAMAEGSKIAARRGSQQAQIGYQKWLADDFLSAVEEERKFREASFGKHTTQIASSFEYPKAASAPRLDRQQFLTNYIALRRLGIDDATARAQAGKIAADIAATQANTEQIRAGTAKTQAETRKLEAEASGQAATPEERERLAKAQSGADNTLASIAAFVRQNGGEFNPQTGEITGLDTPSTAWAHLGEAEREGAKQALATIGVGYARVINENAELSPEAAREVKPELGMRDAPLQAKLQTMAQELIRRRQTAGASVSSAARADREKQRGGAARERASNAGGGGLKAE